MTKNPLLALLLLTASCADDRLPAPTAEESAQLNEAEELLDAEAAKEDAPQP